MGATPTGATPTGPTLDPLNILVNKFNIATHVALILFLFSSWINYLLYDTKSVMVFWQLLSKIKRFVTIFRISWNGPTLFNIPIGDFPPYQERIWKSAEDLLTFISYILHLHVWLRWLYCLTIIGCNFVLNVLLHQTLISYNGLWFTFPFIHIWWHHDDVIKF